MRFSSSMSFGADDSKVTDLFVDRKPESLVLKDALLAHRRNLEDDSEVGNSRHNVLMYYGLGGLGKSSLSERLESWLQGRLPLMNGWGRKPDIAVDSTIRIDLSPSGGHFDAVAAVIAIRQELGLIKKSWPAFDFAFTAYWGSTHPGEDLPSFGRNDNGFAEAATGLITNVVSDFGLLNIASGLGTHAVRAIINEIRGRKLRRLAFESFDGYRYLVERCVDEPTSTEPKPELVVELAHLLARELATLEKDSPLVVVFVDTVERLVNDPRRIGEKLLNQLVYSMPNVLFVMTGRNRLDWHDIRRTNLFVSGPSIWPGLVAGSTEEPRQHLIGKLSEADTRKVVLLGREKYGLDIEKAVVEEIVKASGGLPLYLELARTVAINAKNNGKPSLTLADVEVSLDQLVLRVFEDIPDDEQRALQAASMFTYFDTGLIAAAADVDQGVAERAVLRPMIDHHPGLLYPYRMHDEVRNAIRNASHSHGKNWAAADWYEAGSRAMQESHNRFRLASEAEDNYAMLAAIGLAIAIVCDQEVRIEPSDSPTYSDWLTKAILFGPSIEGLEAFIPVVSKTEYGQKILDFIRARFGGTSVDESLKLLQPILDSGHPIALPAGRHLAYKLRNNDYWDEALEIFEDLIGRVPSQLHVYQRSFTLVSARRFGEAQRMRENLIGNRQDSFDSLILQIHGRPELWIQRRPAVMQRLKESGKIREELETRGSHLRLSTLLVGDVSVREVNQLFRQAEDAGYSPAIRDCLFIKALWERSATLERNSSLERLDYLDRRAFSGKVGHRTGLALVLNAYVFDNFSAIPELVAEMGMQPSRSRHWIPIEILLEHMGTPASQVHTDWLEPYEDVKSNWIRILEDYKQRVLSAN